MTREQLKEANDLSATIDSLENHLDEVKTLLESECCDNLFLQVKPNNSRFEKFVLRKSILSTKEIFIIYRERLERALDTAKEDFHKL